MTNQPLVDILSDMNLHELYPDIGTGWRDLMRIVSDVALAVHADYAVTAINRHNGMMQVVFTPVRELTDISAGVTFMVDAAAYRIERFSARICEDCGQHGNRRTELPTTQTLCTRCYALKYSEFKDSQT